MKGLRYSVAALITAFVCSCSAVQVGAEPYTNGVIMNEAVLSVQSDGKTAEIALNATEETEVSSENKEVDYSKVQAVLSLRDGRPADEVEILDTLTAKLVGSDENASYRWQGSLNGKDWSAIDGATTPEYLITYENTYNYIRCTIKIGRLSFRSKEVKLPKRVMAAPAWGEGDSSQHMGADRENSNPDYIFRIKGKGFVLLDDHDNSDASFYVTTTDAYGDAVNSSYGSKSGQPQSKSVSAHGIYTQASDGNNIGKMLTTLGNNFAYIGEEHNTMYVLPEMMTKYISEDVAFPFWSSYWLQNKNFYKSPKKGTVWMLAWDDFIKYSDRLGYKDDVFASGGEYYFLRCASPIESWAANSVVTSTGSSVCQKNAIGVIRPAFFLNEEFFKNVKLDSLGDAGKGVLEIMKRRYYLEDLQKLYTKEELLEAGFISRSEKEGAYVMTNAGVSMKNATDADISIRLRNDSDEIKVAHTAVLFYNDNKELIDIEFIRSEIAPDSISEDVHSVSIEERMDEVCEVTAMLLAAVPSEKDNNLDGSVSVSDDK